jgi:hypothetical protein
MSHGRDQILVGNEEGNMYRSNVRLALPKGFHVIMRDKQGFSVYDEHGDLLSCYWNRQRLPFELCVANK